MRIKKPYSDEFKKEIAKKYFNGEKAKDLAEQYALSSGVQLVYLWFKEFYPDIYYNKTKNKDKIRGDLMSKKDNQIDELLAALEKAQTEVLIEKKKREKAEQLNDILETKNQVLEKSTASYAKIMAQMSMNNREEQELLIQNTKAFKHYSYIACYQLLTRIDISQNQILKFFKITKKRFIEFKKKNQWPNFWDVRSGIMPMPIFNDYQSKVAPNAKECLDKIYKKAKLPISALKLNEILAFKFRVHVSVPKIREIQAAEPNRFKFVNRKKNSQKGIDRKGNCIKEDIILDKIEGHNAFGIDGVHFPVKIKNSHKNPVVIIAYDLTAKTIVGFNAEFSETSESAYKVFSKTSAYIKAEKIENAIIQTDRGSAFACYLINDLEKELQNYTHSMSKAGFKHNPWTESLNGWVKDSFIEEYGSFYNSLEEFSNTFQEFANSWNVLKISMYNLKNAKKSNLFL